MDLERIKQNLRLRSKRPKNLSKGGPVSYITNIRPLATANGNVKEPTQNNSKNPSAVKASPQISNTSAKKTPRPERSRATTASSEKTDKNTSAQDIPKHNMSGTNNSQEVEDSEYDDFDLKPPAPRPKPSSIESLSESLFSAEYLNSILHDSRGVARFTAFLTKFKPEYHPVILKYLETQKAIKAVEYANAIAEGIIQTKKADGDKNGSNPPSTAASLSQEFATASEQYFDTLVGSALPMYITYDLVKVSTECLINEITGRQTPVMRDLVGGLSEAFCITDPKQNDNPIIYASEEFYRLTGYGSEDVIGRNCRFLQGPKTKVDSQRRLKETITKGDEISETILNYRRDGRPFINLLMVAPLHDGKGNVKYNIGAQVDVSGLVEGGKGLDNFLQFLMSKQQTPKLPNNGDLRNPKALDKLRELSEMLDFEEAAVVQTHSRSSSVSRAESQTRSSGSSQRRNATRRVLVESESEESDAETERGRDDWELAQDTRSGKLPGVYDSYMLIRPAPSLRIIFVSPKLRQIGKLVQKPFLSRVAAPAATLAGLKESFTNGVPVSAKIHLMGESGDGRDGTKTSPGSKHEDNKYGRACWISATPLLGSDDSIGVWMVVVVEKSKARRSVNPSKPNAGITVADDSNQGSPETPTKSRTSRSKQQHQQDAPQNSSGDFPIKPRRLGDDSTAPKDHETKKPVTKQETQPAEEKAMDKKDHHEDNEGNESDEDQVGTSTIRPNGMHDDEYVTHHEKQEPTRADRVHIQPDSEDESPPGSHNSSNSWSPGNNDSPPTGRKYTPPPEIPASMRIDGQEEKDEQDDTPTKEQFHSHPLGEEKSNSGRHTQKPKRRMFMDYSRQISDFHSGQPNSASSAKQDVDDGGRESESDQFSASDCARSPYSVD